MRKMTTSISFVQSRRQLFRLPSLFLALVMVLLGSAAALSLTMNNNSRPIPITVLSGFLGTGKTTLLQNMLENKKGLRIGVVVNDVASVNIDSKLVAQGSSSSSLADGMVELQNGCACCSLSDELLTSVANLVTMSDLKQQADDDEDAGFHHIVIELSGVADPKAIRAKFQEAVMEQMPLMERVQLDTMVSLVDCSTFQHHFQSTSLATRDEMPELFTETQEIEEEEWMKDLPPKLLEQVLKSLRGEDNENPEGVADLLTSQTETADLVVLNKEDLVDTTELQQLKEIVGALNPRAKVFTTSFGKLDLTQVLGVAKGVGVAVAGAVDDHRDYVEAAADAAAAVSAHSHSHEHEDEKCEDPNCTDPSHEHSHSHDHKAEKDCTDPDCTDPSHSHSHSHDHTAETACSDPDCTDPSHSHSHSHDHTTCDDPDCTDHSHSHSHDHASDPATYVGIGSFVYRARRPFHPGRLVSFLGHLPVVRGVPEGEKSEIQMSAETESVLKKCLRSKGFVWCAHSHTDALYWSHAGSSFELNCLGQWWATLPREQWPPGVDEYVLRDFDVPEHDDATNPVGVGD
mmetsp:Transcript_5010/g.14738  ORF Transcript_5010/g.14738 Transcript_5010/m.14738 type:complete len:573 (+) Transcript_5010:110-1828(+)